jgi:hypothetical protein
VATYTITFQIDCPQKEVTLQFSSTGSGFVFLNGQPIASWILPYPYQQVSSLTLKQPNLQCGCNKLTILVYNYYYSSPAALTYSLSQNSAGCYDCQNTGVTFYNRKTCQCECSAQQQCSNALMEWKQYPACGCGCKANTKLCAVGRYFSQQSCQCECREKCCPDNQRWDKDQCDCVPACSVAQQCRTNFYWNNQTCKCECSGAAISCMVPATLNFDTCQCECSGNNVLCPSPKQWDKVSCTCVCPACPQGQSVSNNSTCECSNDNCQPQPCGGITYWNSQLCRCIPACDFPVPCKSN